MITGKTAAAIAGSMRALGAAEYCLGELGRCTATLYVAVSKGKSNDGADDDGKRLNHGEGFYKGGAVWNR